MTDAELSAFVAEKVMDWSVVWKDRVPYRGFMSGDNTVTTGLIKFAVDRNACAEAEARIGELGTWMQGQYIAMLVSICVPRDLRNSRAGHFLLATATARQRCEAMAMVHDAFKEKLK